MNARPTRGAPPALPRTGTSSQQLQHSLVARVVTVQRVEQAVVEHQQQQQLQQAHARQRRRAGEDAGESLLHSGSVLSLEAAYAKSPPHAGHLTPSRRASRSTAGSTTSRGSSAPAPASLRVQQSWLKQPVSASRLHGSDAAPPCAPVAQQLLHPEGQAHAVGVVEQLWELWTSQPSKGQSGDGAAWPAFGARAPRVLTAEEEAVLGGLVQQHRKVVQHRQLQEAAAAGGAPPLRSRGGRGGPRWPPPLSPADVAEASGLGRAWLALLPGLAARAEQLLVAFNVGLVYMMMGGRRSRGLPRDDLAAAGLAGLRVAAARYDPARGTRFSTVASMWVLQAMGRTEDLQAAPIRTPVRHTRMLRAVVARWGPEALAELDTRPDVLEAVGASFRARPATVLRAVRSAAAASYAASLDALAPSAPSGEGAPAPWSALLTSTDLDDDEGDGGEQGSAAPTGFSGEGSFVASSGRVPGWALEPQWPPPPQQQQQQQRQQQQRRRQVERGGQQQQLLLGSGGGGGVELEPLLAHLDRRERAVVQLLFSEHEREEVVLAVAAAAGAPQRRRSAGGSLQPPAQSSWQHGRLGLQEVGDLLGMTPENVRQIRNKALDKMRRALAEGAPAPAGGGAGGAGSAGGAGGAAEAPPPRPRGRPRRPPEAAASDQPPGARRRLRRSPSEQPPSEEPPSEQPPSEQPPRAQPAPAEAERTSAVAGAAAGGAAGDQQPARSRRRPVRLLAAASSEQPPRAGVATVPAEQSAKQEPEQQGGQRRRRRPLQQQKEQQQPTWR